MSLKPQAENIPPADGKSKYVLRVGIDRVNNKGEYMIQFWIMDPSKLKGDNGTLVLVSADQFVGGINAQRYDGLSWKGKDRALNLSGLTTSTTTVSQSYPNSDSVERVSVDTAQLRAVVEKYVDMCLGTQSAN